jgi:2-polyprenyl-6-methoxyphenol hydroxylase-like FAD-dependent oxidoreductase
MSTSNRLKIAIIGAGPAGCTLARLLVQEKVPVDITIFEGEKSLDTRTQGGTLDLHTQSGIEALKRAGLYDEFVKRARFDGEGKASSFL